MLIIMCHAPVTSLCWQGETAEWLTVTFEKPLGASEIDRAGVFSAIFKYTLTTSKYWFKLLGSELLIGGVL